MQPLYVDEIEASRITGIKVSTLRSHRHRRRGMRYVKFGSRVLYCLRDLAAASKEHHHKEEVKT